LLINMPLSGCFNDIIIYRYDALAAIIFLEKILRVKADTTNKIAKNPVKKNDYAHREPLYDKRN